MGNGLNSRFCGPLPSTGSWRNSGPTAPNKSADQRRDVAKVFMGGEALHELTSDDFLGRTGRLSGSNMLTATVHSLKVSDARRWGDPECRTARSPSCPWRL
jgi:hypothetical protein